MIANLLGFGKTAQEVKDAYKSHLSNSRFDMASSQVVSRGFSDLVQLHHPPEGVFHNEIIAKGDIQDTKDFYTNLGLNCKVATRKKNNQKVCRINFFGQEMIAVEPKGKIYPHAGITLSNPLHYQAVMENMHKNGIKILDVDHKTGEILSDKAGKETIQYKDAEKTVIKQRMFYIQDPSGNILQIKHYPDMEDHQMIDNKSLLSEK